MINFMEGTPTAGSPDRTQPDDALSLDAIRNVLCRLEETILFGLIERTQFAHNPVIYEPDGAGPSLGGESLVGFLLRECERSYARVRRYLSPDEIPFYSGLPPPVLPKLDIPNPLHSRPVNLNPALRAAYEREIVPFLCRPGDDRQWGSSAVNDVALLQSLSKRVHYGQFVAESKYRREPERFNAWIRAGDEAALFQAITDPAMETLVLDRVQRKAVVYGAELMSGPGPHSAGPDTIRAIYSRWVIPLNKRVQTLYLLSRLS
jgi:chorismate mutase